MEQAGAAAAHTPASTVSSGTAQRPWPGPRKAAALPAFTSSRSQDLLGASQESAMCTCEETIYELSENWFCQCVSRFHFLSLPAICGRNARNRAYKSYIRDSNPAGGLWLMCLIFIYPPSSRSFLHCSLRPSLGSLLAHH